MLHRTGNATGNAQDRLDAIAHLATEGKALGIGAGGLRPETALEAITVLAASSLSEAIALRGRAMALDLESLPAERIDFEAHLEAVRKRLIQEALDRCAGVQTKAAKLLGMSFRSFRYYAKKYNLVRKPDEKEPEIEPAAESVEQIGPQ